MFAKEMSFLGQEFTLLQKFQDWKHLKMKRNEERYEMRNERNCFIRLVTSYRSSYQ